MNEAQERIVSVLARFDSICAKAQIDYSVGYRLAWDVVKFGRFHDSTYDAVVHVKSSDLISLRHAVSSDSGGTPLKWYQAASGNVSIYDGNTAVVDLWRRQDDTPCSLGVCVVPLNDSRQDVLSCPVPGGQDIYLPPAFLDAVNRIGFEGATLSISVLHAVYFSELVGETWRERNWPFPINVDRFGVVVAASVPFADIGRRASAQGISIDALRDDWKSFNLWLSTEYRQSERAALNAKYVLGFEQERFRLWEKYCYSKKELLERRSRGASAIVSKALEDYADQLKLYYKRLGKTLYFDEELFQLVLFVLEEEGYRHCGSLRAAIPQNHLKPLSEVMGEP